MSLLGENLKSLHKQCDHHFSIKTLALLALEILRRIETLHNRGILHRDIKPENIVIGSKDDANTVYLIDFGLSVPYLTEDGKHVPFSKNSQVSGTLYYLSSYGHLGIRASRRDDLISLGYMLVHLFKGKLPWINLPGDIETKIKRMFQMKSTMNYEILCQGLPQEFCEYMKYVTSLSFNLKPDYEYLKELFKNVLEIMGLKEDGAFDWIELEKKGIDLNARKILEEGLDKYMKKGEESVTLMDFEFY